jgi:DNA-3-methyladenine glycosylase I
MTERCSWAARETLMIYHDQEWGVPLHDDQKLFEFLILDAFQAGLTWELILIRRPAFRAAFSDFKPEIVAAYDPEYLDSLMQNPGIIRNRLKIKAAKANATAFLKIQAEFGSFDRYIWQFVGGAPRVNTWQTLQDIPAVSDESTRMSKDLKQRGFSFVGPTICYAFMQAAGLINDHLVSCFRYNEVSTKY